MVGFAWLLVVGVYRVGLRDWLCMRVLRGFSDFGCVAIWALIVGLALVMSFGFSCLLRCFGVGVYG